ncbi:MAG TPA: hypothetical protein VFX19_07885, partial [Dehalococcoidia bacterium]|nr:hypothetical protein [Dehalococcoidia bacterium]
QSWVDAGRHAFPQKQQLRTDKRNPLCNRYRDGSTACDMPPIVYVCEVDVKSIRSLLKGKSAELVAIQLFDDALFSGTVL